MFNYFALVYAEFYMSYCTAKKYLFNTILRFIGNVIVLSGFIFLGASINSYESHVDISFMIKILSWYFLTCTVGVSLREVENSIRMDNLRNIIHQKNSFVNIIFSKMLTVQLKVILLYLVPIIFIVYFFGLGNNYDIKAITILLYFLLVILLTITLCYLFIYAVLHLKRISATQGIFNYYLLFFSGFVFVDSIEESTFIRFNNALQNGRTMWNAIFLIAFLMSSVSLILVLRFKISKKIHLL